VHTLLADTRLTYEVVPIDPVRARYRSRCWSNRQWPRLMGWQASPSRRSIVWGVWKTLMAHRSGAPPCG